MRYLVSLALLSLALSPALAGEPVQVKSNPIAGVPPVITPKPWKDTSLSFMQPHSSRRWTDARADWIYYQSQRTGFTATIRTGRRNR